MGVCLGRVGDAVRRHGDGADVVVRAPDLATGRMEGDEEMVVSESVVSG